MSPARQSFRACLLLALLAGCGVKDDPSTMVWERDRAAYLKEIPKGARITKSIVYLRDGGVDTVTAWTLGNSSGCDVMYGNWAVGGSTSFNVQSGRVTQPDSAVSQ